VIVPEALGSQNLVLYMTHCMVSMRITSLVVLTVLFLLLLLLLNSLAVHLTVKTDALDGELVVAA
jgi:hypothetical protein